MLKVHYWSAELGVFVEMTPAYPGVPMVAHLFSKLFKKNALGSDIDYAADADLSVPDVGFPEGYLGICFVLFFVPRLWRLTSMMVFKDVKVTLTCEIGCNQPRNSQQPRFQGCSLLDCSEIQKRKLLMMKMGGFVFFFLHFTKH